MRILDEQNQELTLTDVDYSLGYLKEEEVVLETYDREYHYEVSRFYFKDDTSYTIESLDDPHVKTISVSQGIFEYIPQENEEEKEIRGMDVRLIIDKEAGKHTETIQRYVKYTDDELIIRGLPVRMNAIENGVDEINKENLPNRVTLTEETIQEMGIDVEDLILLFAEVLGGSEEEEEELIEDENIEEYAADDENIEEPVEDKNDEPIEDEIFEQTDPVTDEEVLEPVEKSNEIEPTEEEQGSDN